MQDELFEQISEIERNTKNELYEVFQSITDEVYDLCVKISDFETESASLKIEINNIIENYTKTFNTVLANGINDAYLLTQEKQDALIDIKQRMYITDHIITKTAPDSYLYNLTTKRNVITSNKKLFQDKGIFSHILELFVGEQEVVGEVSLVERVKSVLSNIKDSYNLFTNEKIIFRQEPNPGVVSYLENNVFRGSKNILNNYNNNVYKIIQKKFGIEGYNELEVLKDIQASFPELNRFNAGRIARTEINKAQANATWERLLSNETVDYVQWITLGDEKVRDSHAEQDQMIVKLGDLFPNGCRYPHDDLGDPDEVICCRCDIEAWYMPPGYEAPVDYGGFFENEIIPIPDYVSPSLEDMGLIWE